MKKFLFLTLGLWMASSAAWAIDYGDNDDDQGLPTPTRAVALSHPASTPASSPVPGAATPTVTPSAFTPTPVPQKVKNWQDAADTWPSDEDGPPIIKSSVTPSVTATPFEDQSYATMAGMMPYQYGNSGDRPKAAPVPNKPVSTPTVALNTAPPSSGHGVLQFQGGLFLPVSGQAATLLSPGFTGEVMAGYAFDSSFTLGLDVGFFNLPYAAPPLLNAFNLKGVPGVALTSVPALNHTPVELVGQYTIPTDFPLKPYLLFGLGLAFDSINGTAAADDQGNHLVLTFPNQNFTNFEMDEGLGITFASWNTLQFFIQGKIALDFDSAGESGDTPIVAIPLQAGINISLY
jgi:hypothetical protein